MEKPCASCVPAAASRDEIAVAVGRLHLEGEQHDSARVRRGLLVEPVVDEPLAHYFLAL